MTTTVQITTDFRAAWLNSARKWQSDQAASFHLMQIAQKRGDADAFDAASFYHAEAHEQFLICMEYAASNEPTYSNRETLAYLEAHPEMIP